VLEATGGRELRVAAALAAAGLAIAVVGPRQGRDFARAVDQLTKTDAHSMPNSPRRAPCPTPERRS